MALNIQTFKTRALTALIFVAVMLTGLLWNFWSFLVLFTVIHFGCWFEFVKLMRKIYAKKYLLYCLLGFLYITMPVLLILDLRTGSRIYTNRFVDSIFYDVLIPGLIIFSIWINDTSAYLVGSFIGKTPLTKISPKKTLEGTIGGAVLAVLIIGFIGNNISFDSVQSPYPGLHIQISRKIYFIIPAICAIFGTLGDLFESKLKRMANVKDSGSIMPGHGGFLDRFDSLLFAVPAVWVYVHLFL